MVKKVIGIQGGLGSYNEAAILAYLKNNAEYVGEINYLYNSKNVLDALKNNLIDFGQFAVSNSVGGYVTESLEAIADFLTSGNGLDVIARYQLSIAHCLMAHQSSRLEDVEKIISHPQVYKQCQNTLNAKYERLKFIEGTGEYADPAKVAEGISNGQFGSNIATLSNPHIAEIYGLKILARELQDFDSNKTEFLLVEKVKKLEISRAKSC